VDGIYAPSDQPQGLRRGSVFLGVSVPVEPSVKRTVAFVDGQNLFYAAKKAFGHRFPTTENRRGINGTEWIHIDRATYDACLDPNDYRPKP
jgi:hypothetical protein